MFSKCSNYNELGNSEVSVWTKLSPGIPHETWASLCRSIGNLSPSEFRTVVTFLNAHKCLKNALKRQVGGILGQNKGKDLPLVSAGPSGIGGEYQVELQVRTVQGHREVGMRVGSEGRRLKPLAE